MKLIFEIFIQELINSQAELEGIPMAFIILISIIVIVLLTIIIYLGIKSQKIKNSTGKFAIIGEIGIAKTDISPQREGKVLVQGEIWQAISTDIIFVNDKVKIINIKSMILLVEKIIDKNQFTS